MKTTQSNLKFNALFTAAFVAHLYLLCAVACLLPLFIAFQRLT